MRNFQGRFSSVTDMKVRIMEEFKEQVPQLITFSISYFEGHQSAKYWIYTEDLSAMYSHCGTEIMLWCDGQTGDEPPSAKRQRTDGVVTKREEKEQKVEELAKELKERNESMELSEVQYRLWARMIITGVHSDKDTPPQIPMITGITPKRKQNVNDKSDLQEAIISTAAAVVKAVNTGSGSTLIQSPSIQQTIQDTSTLHTSNSKPGHSLLGVSPGKVAEIRGKSFGQLSTLKRLYDDCVLTVEEFEEQKSAILSGLKKLSD